MKIAVTGGLGFIGSHTCLALSQAGHELWILDNQCNSDLSVLGTLNSLAPSKMVFENLDLRDSVSLKRFFLTVRPNAVIHFAGVKSVAESVRDPLKYYDNNVVGTIKLLQAMDGVGCSSIIFSSSATVYGEPKALPYKEEHPTSPVNPYGQSKLMAENVLRDWVFAGENRSAVALRYFNPIGADNSGRMGESPTTEPTNLMPVLLEVAGGARRELSIFGNDYDTPDGTCVRDYIHVSDLAAAHVSALAGLTANNLDEFEVFNIGTGKGLSVLQLVGTFREVSGVDVPHRFAQRRSGDIPEYWADASKANDVLGWRANFSDVEMCADSWRWHRYRKAKQ